MAKIVLPAKMENLENLVEFVTDQARKAEFPDSRTAEIRLVAEEVLVNIFSYAYPETGGDVFIGCIRGEDILIFDVQDNGIPFNILTVPDPDITSCLSDRCVGGLGIYFVKEMATEARYVRENDRNRLTLIFHKDRQK